MCLKRLIFSGFFYIRNSVIQKAPGHGLSGRVTEISTGGPGVLQRRAVILHSWIHHHGSWETIVLDAGKPRTNAISVRITGRFKKMHLSAIWTTLNNVLQSIFVKQSCVFGTYWILFTNSTMQYLRIACSKKSGKTPMCAPLSWFTHVQCTQQHFQQLSPPHM